MEITLEKIELVKDRTGSTYAEAKAALEAAEGSVVDAIIALEEEMNKEHDRVDGASLKDSPLFAKLKEIVEYMPLERMLLETDCPYLAPVPFRGQRNDSTMLKYVVSAAAEITLAMCQEWL